MTFPARPRIAAGTAIALALLLAGCGGSKPKNPDVDAMDRELVGNESGNATDPAITGALQDQIMVDPALTQQREAGALPPGTAPGQSAVPSTLPGGGAAGGQTLGELAQNQAAGKGATNAACYRDLQYGTGWAQRLPAALPLYADAQVSEAAGNGCNVRIVSYASGAAPAKVADFYVANAKRGGYAVEAKPEGADRVVGGDKGADAFYATIRPRAGGGTAVDIVTNHGR